MEICFRRGSCRWKGPGIQQHRNTLDTSAPLRRVRMHPDDKEWMTPYIKDQIRSRQRAFVKGDKARYQLMCAKVEDQEAKASEQRYTNPSKWFKCIYSLCGAQRQSTTPTAPTMEDLQNVADQLLQAFTAPCENCEPTAIAANDLSERFPDRLPPIPSIG